MEPFVTHTGRFVCLDRANVDTDAIMPARFLKWITRTGYGDVLFEDIRKKDGEPDPDFPLHRPEAQGATIQVARHNFGCGSSREHAVWGLAQAGFRVIIAPRVGSVPGFADIFRQNCYKNGVLPVEVPEGFAHQLFGAGSGEIDVSLLDQTVTARLPQGDFTERFEIPRGARQMLLDGLDEIDLTLQYESHIEAYESRSAR